MYVDARRTKKERIRFLASDHTFGKNPNLVKKNANVCSQELLDFFYFAQKVGGGVGAKAPLAPPVPRVLQ